MISFVTAPGLSWRFLHGDKPCSVAFPTPAECCNYDAAPKLPDEAIETYTVNCALLESGSPWLGVSPMSDQTPHSAVRTQHDGSEVRDPNYGARNG